MRREARENAFRFIFASLFDGGDVDNLKTELMEPLGPDDAEYFSAVTEGAARERAFLTKVIGRYAGGYRTERIYKIDLAILLLAGYEILFEQSVPDKVSINEAVELAKTYSTEASPSFVNGVLASVLKDKEAIIDERNSD